MDTYFEQLITIKRGAKEFLKMLGIWVAALIISALLIFLSLVIPMFGTVFVFMVVFCFFGAYKLSKRLFIEYEYIFTNGALDVDKIIAQNSRKRMLSLEVSSIEVLEKYNPASPPTGDFAKKIIACNTDSQGVYYAIINDPAKGKRLLVFTPDDRMKEAIKKFLPRFMQFSAFKD